MRSVASALRCLSSWLDSYANFRTAIGPPFMPLLRTQWSCGAQFSPPGRTFRNYLCHLKKGFMLDGANLDWYTHGVNAASDGLRRPKRGQFAFPNFIFSKDLFATISTLGWERMFSLSWFLPLSYFPLEYHPDHYNSEGLSPTTRFPNSPHRMRRP